MVLINYPCFVWWSFLLFWETDKLQYEFHVIYEPKFNFNKS